MNIAARKARNTRHLSVSQKQHTHKTFLFLKISYSQSCVPFSTRVQHKFLMSRNITSTNFSRLQYISKFFLFLGISYLQTFWWFHRNDSENRNRDHIEMKHTHTHDMKANYHHYYNSIHHSKTSKIAHLDSSHPKYEAH